MVLNDGVNQLMKMANLGRKSRCNPWSNYYQNKKRLKP